jgi:hypothetical protein
MVLSATPPDNTTSTPSSEKRLSSSVSVALKFISLQIPPCRTDACYETVNGCILPFLLNAHKP